ncbi:MAG: hypothetical protein ACLGHN_14960 [Bacteriovoracia bacterium]
MKVLFFLFSLAVLCSCDWRVDLNGDTDGKSGTGGSGGAGSGGACATVITPDFFQSNNTTTSFDGTTFTHTATANPAGEGAGVDTTNVASNTTGITYFEITYTGSTGATGVQLATIFAESGFAAYSTIRLRPDMGDITDNMGNPIVSGLTINPGYVLGFWLNHDTGDTFYQDSFGNTGLLENVPGLIGVNVMTGMAGTPADIIGATITGTHNVGNSAFSLTPPLGAKDWCGNALN